jgi:long-chain acyl-CoA synthetase
MNLAHWLNRAAIQTPTAPAIALGKTVWCNYHQMAESAARGAAWFKASGLRPGDCVAIFMPNCPEYLIIQWAAWWAGLTVVPINARLHVLEAAWIANDSCARIAFCEPEQSEALDKALSRIGGSECQVTASLSLIEYHKTADIEERADIDAMWLFYTSGTTGRPKGAMLGVRQLRNMVLGYLTEVRNIKQSDCAMHPAPLSHGSGLYHLPYVWKGALNVIPESRSFDEPEILELAEFWGNASFFAAPIMINRLTAYAKGTGKQPNGLDVIVYGGAPMYTADLREALKYIGPRFAQIYGQGECPMTITVLPQHLINDHLHPDYESRLASVGYPHSMLELSIRDNDNHAVPAGTTGEVCVKGEIVMLGYWRNYGATCTAVRDGWLRTGDLGWTDARGLLTLVDRSKDSIISGGTNIYPREIEEVLLAHPDIHEVSVIGRHCGVWGERVVAYVVPENSDTDPAELARLLDEFLLDRLSRFKRPRGYRVVDSLPKSAYGKILKTELRAMEESQPPWDQVTLGATLVSSS